MGDQLTLSAEAREGAGKGASRDLRRNGRVPAVIYGDNQEPAMIYVEEKELNKLLGTGYFMNSVVKVDVGGKAARRMKKDVAFHPETDRPQHVDCMRDGEHKSVTVAETVLYQKQEGTTGTKSGGVHKVVRRE